MPASHTVPLLQVYPEKALYNMSDASDLPMVFFVECISALPTLTTDHLHVTNGEAYVSNSVNGNKWRVEVAPIAVGMYYGRGMFVTHCSVLCTLSCSVLYTIPSSFLIHTYPISPTHPPTQVLSLYLLPCLPPTGASKLQTDPPYSTLLLVPFPLLRALKQPILILTMFESRWSLTNPCRTWIVRALN
jgi:hypothetical protein